MQSLQSREILLVDDNHDFTLLMSRALTKRGFEVLVAHDADSAKSLMSDVIEYAIVDLSLGKDSGLDLIAHIKTINPIAQVLLYTGYASIATAVAAIKLGATNYRHTHSSKTTNPP
jgi:two-component system, response regulator RegA